MRDTDPNIIDEFKKGDSVAFAAFFHLHYRPLCYFAVQLVNDHAEAEDIVKDTFVKLWHKHGDFESGESIKAFLYITARNACLNFIRHLKVKDTFRKELAYLEEGKGEEMILNQLIHAELLREIYQEIEKMPEKRREVFRLAYFDGLRNEEIADFLNISIHTVKEHKGKALTFLRSRFSNRQIIVFVLFCAKCLEVMEK
jgi:RNA polymerase sigma-70 factor (ECF subfamily)